MSNNCNSKCWWRCGIPSLEHIDLNIQQQLFSKVFWFLEQDCDNNECYCSTNDNLNEDCEMGQIKYGNCLNYNDWTTSSYHESCSDLSPPQTECGEDCCDTLSGSKVCCDNQCVTPDLCCGNKVFDPINEECCDDTIVNKCRRFVSKPVTKPCFGNPCGIEKGARCGCPDNKVCCNGECVSADKCCGDVVIVDDRKCCKKNNFETLCEPGYECTIEDPDNICCKPEYIVNNLCCLPPKKKCGQQCCNRTQECIDNIACCATNEIFIQETGECCHPNKVATKPSKFCCLENICDDGSCKAKCE